VSLLAQTSGVWPVLSLLMFLSLFVGVLLWLWIVPARRWQRDARMPLEEAPVEARVKETER
jgi:hypothetical protein